MFKVDKPLTNANVPRTIRFTEQLFEELNKVACEQDVSFNTLVLECCIYALAHLDEDGEDAK